jgi:DNA-binding CsgD family transcriptional regulator
MRASLRGVCEAAAEALELEELEASALPALERLVGANGALLYRYDDDGAFRVLGGDLVAVMAGYGPELREDDPTQQVHVQFGPGPRIVPASALAGSAHRRSPAYQAVYGPHDLEHLLCVWLTEARPGEPGMTGLLLTRPRRSGPFDSGRHRRIARALPSLCAAVRRDRRVRALRTSLGPPAAPRWRCGLDGFARHHGLTHAERQVMLGLALGHTNAQIAERRDVSVETARTHVKHILSKLGARTRTQAAQCLWAWEDDAP